ncbi:hypothetical protein L596_029584 [Steinernema carpocapsae]|uniref:Uncharacterized protein n=1 Tax=Steinernema carpocapsae TaxID=34508 RepID=A0A4U5LV22_STECR|nr:hypothetical protein L596_029584 [Steinernema carpocapsae]
MFLSDDAADSCLDRQRRGFLMPEAACLLCDFVRYPLLSYLGSDSARFSIIRRYSRSAAARGAVQDLSVWVRISPDDVHFFAHPRPFRCFPQLIGLSFQIQMPAERKRSRRLSPPAEPATPGPLRRSSRRSAALRTPKETPEASRQSSPSSFDPSALEDPETALKMYEGFADASEFLSIIPKANQEKFLKAVVAANGGKMRCANASCSKKTFATGIGLVRHLRTCPNTPGKEEAPMRRSVRVPIKREKYSPTLQTQLSPPPKIEPVELKEPPKTRESKAKSISRPSSRLSKEEAVDSTAGENMEYAEFSANMGSWNALTKKTKQALIKKAISESEDGSVKCLNDDCEETFSKVDQVINHLTSCFVPLFLTFMGKIDEYRSFGGHIERKKLIRDALMSGYEVLDCLNKEAKNCEQQYGNAQSMFYHLERCNLDYEKRPWECYRCHYKGVASESQAHLEMCSKMSAANPLGPYLQDESDDEDEVEMFSDDFDPSSDNVDSDPDVEISHKRIKKEILEDSLEVTKPKRSRRSTKKTKAMGEEGALAVLQNGATRVDKMGRSFQSRTAASVSMGRMPESGSRLSIHKGRKRFKFKSNAAQIGPPSIVDRQRYDHQIAKSRKSYFDDPTHKVVDGAVGDRLRFTIQGMEVKALRECHDAESWLNRTSVGFRVPLPIPKENRVVKTPKRRGRPPKNASCDEENESLMDLSELDSSLVENESEASPSPAPPVVNDPTPGELTHLKLFESKAFKYSIEQQKTLCNTSRVSPHRTEDVDIEGEALYIGGPVSALAVCPRKLDEAREVVAVTTFPDDDMLIPHYNHRPENPLDRVQFYTYEPAKPGNARLWFLLEARHGYVLDMAWCPLREMATEEDERDILGYLAVASSLGVIAIYCIPKEPHLSDSIDTPLISLPPALILRHAPCILQSGLETSEIPIQSVAWSPYDGGRHIGAVSAAGKAFVCDLTSDDNDVIDLTDDYWESPPTNICFLNFDEVSIAFRQKQVRVYNFSTGDLVLTEDTTKSAGACVSVQPVLMNGAFVFQSDMISYGDVLVESAVFMTMGVEEGYLLVPLEMKHEVRLMKMAMCENTGIVVSIGLDGRMYASLNGRLSAHESLTDYNFNFILPRLRLVRRRIQGKEEDDVFNSQEEIVNGLALDLQFGDRYTHGVKEMVPNKLNKLPEVTVDRRIESLTALEISRHTPGLTITGGDAGLLFIVPATL